MKYFTLQETLSRNAILSMVIGHRSAGKTYSFKEWAIRDWLKTGKEFCYCRRYKNELNNIKDSFFDDIAYKYNIEVKVFGRKCEARQMPSEEDANEMTDKQLSAKYKWKTFGYFIPLSQQQMFKSATFPNINKICLDEFIIENRRQKYLDNEVDQLLSLYFTIDRDRCDVRILLLSNSGYLSNPYFSEYDIKASDLAKSDWIKRNKGFAICHYFQNEENTKHLVESNLGKISTEKYRNYALYNEFNDANNSFIIDKRPKHYTHLISLTDGETQLDIYKSINIADITSRSLWVNIGKIPQTCISVDSSQPIENAAYHPEYIRYLKDMTRNLLVSYQSPECRIKWYDFIKP